MTRKRRRSYPAPIGSLLESVFSGQPLDTRLREGKIWAGWDAAVGSQISGKARPLNFRNGTLTVLVGSAPWMQQLSFLKAEIIRKLNTQIGEELVKEIYLKAGRVEPVPVTPPPMPKKARPLTEAEKSAIAGSTSGIEDPELRHAIAELMAKHLASR